MRNEFIIIQLLFVKSSQQKQLIFKLQLRNIDLSAYDAMKSYTIIKI